MSDFITASEDFWARQANVQRYTYTCTALGAPVEITANQEPVLRAAHLAAGRYSRSDTLAGAPIRIQLVVRSDETPPIPADLPERLVYSGVGRWITLGAGEWGHGFGNLDTRTALIFLAPALAEAPVLVSRYFIDHYLLNFLFDEWAMLHASGVVAPTDAALILMVGAHNIGKSTTALRLLRAGYHFLADGMALIQFSHDRLRVGGYPIGEAKLRDDMLVEWPEYAGETVRVREHRKTVVNLRAAHPVQVVETVISPATIHLCFTERADEAATTLAPITLEAARRWLASNTLFWDEPARLEHNSRALNRLLSLAQLHHLRLGADPLRLIAEMQRLH